MLDHLDVGVERLDRLPRRLGLGLADALGVVDHLALQVRLVDQVVIDDPYRADPGRGQVERGRRAQAAGAQQQHLRVQQLHLALDPELGQQGVARVAHPLLGGRCPRPHDRQALGLPLLDPAGDRGGVLVPEAAARRRRGRSGCPRRSRGSPASSVGGDLLDAVGDLVRRDQLVAVDVRLLVLDRVARVDQDGLAALDLLRACSGSICSTQALTCSIVSAASPSGVSPSIEPSSSTSSAPTTTSPSTG